MPAMTAWVSIVVDVGATIFEAVGGRSINLPKKESNVPLGILYVSISVAVLVGVGYLIYRDIKRKARTSGES